MKRVAQLQSMIKQIKGLTEEIENGLNKTVEYNKLLRTGERVQRLSELTDEMHELYISLMLDSKKICVDPAKIIAEQNERAMVAFYLRTETELTFKAIGEILKVTSARARELYQKSRRRYVFPSPKSKMLFQAELSAIRDIFKSKPVAELIEEQRFFFKKKDKTTSQTSDDADINPYKQLIKDIKKNKRKSPNHIELFKECYLLVACGVNFSSIAKHLKITTAEAKYLASWADKYSYDLTL